MRSRCRCGTPSCRCWTAGYRRRAVGVPFDGGGVHRVRSSRPSSGPAPGRPGWPGTGRCRLLTSFEIVDHRPADRAGPIPRDGLAAVLGRHRLADPAAVAGQADPAGRRRHRHRMDAHRGRPRVAAGRCDRGLSAGAGGSVSATVVGRPRFDARDARSRPSRGSGRRCSRRGSGQASRAGNPPVAIGPQLTGSSRSRHLPWSIIACRYSAQSGCSPEMRPEVLDQRFDRLGQVDDGAGGLDLHPGPAEVVGQHQHRHPGVAADVRHLGPFRDSWTRRSGPAGPPRR